MERKGEIGISRERGCASRREYFAGDVSHYRLMQTLIGWRTYVSFPFGLTIPMASALYLM